MFGTKHVLLAATDAARATRNGLRALRRRLRERRTAASLDTLDDAILKDIGICRCEIPSIARALAASPQEA